MRRWGDEAASALVGILIAIVVFGLAFAVLTRVSINQDSGTVESEEAGKKATASVLARSLLRDPGSGWYSGNACTGSTTNRDNLRPDEVQRAGLAEEACAAGEGSAYHRLSYDKLANLAKAKLEADPANGALDYEEARTSLGLDGEGTQFHLRSWPLFDALDRRVSLAMRDPALRALYLGDYDEIRGSETTNYLVQHTAGAVDAGLGLILYVDVTNNGTSTTAFTVTFTVPTPKSIVVEKHTTQLAHGEHQNVTLVLNKTADWTWKDPANPAFDFSIRDPSKTVGEGHRTLSAFPMTIATSRSTLLLEAAQLEYRLQSGSAKIEFVYDAVDGTGDSNVAYHGWTMRLLDASGAIISTATDLKDKGGSRSFMVSSAGTYRAQLLAATGVVEQSDEVNVVNSEIARFEPATAPGQWMPAPSVLPEATYLDTLLASFDLAAPDSAFVSPDIHFDAAGDVFPDDNRYLSDRLPVLLRNATGAGSTENYNVLVIGSNVDHNTLTSSNVKYPVRDWVDAGGTLVVLGSDEQAAQWLEPLFHTGLQLAGGGIGIPDPNHPIITTPNQLDFVALDDHGMGWTFKRDEDRSLFTHVVTAGEEDVLGVSNPGAFGLGRVVLTSWQAFDAVLGDPPTYCTPAALTASCPGLQLLDNFITIAYGALYLDYGPLVPTGGSVASATDIAIVYAPTFAQSLEVYVTIYVFG